MPTLTDYLGHIAAILQKKVGLIDKEKFDIFWSCCVVNPRTVPGTNLHQLVYEQRGAVMLVAADQLIANAPKPTNPRIAEILRTYRHGARVATFPRKSENTTQVARSLRELRAGQSLVLPLPTKGHASSVRISCYTEGTQTKIQAEILAGTRRQHRVDFDIGVDSSARQDVEKISNGLQALFGDLRRQDSHDHGGVFEFLRTAFGAQGPAVESVVSGRQDWQNTGNCWAHNALWGLVSAITADQGAGGAPAAHNFYQHVIKSAQAHIARDPQISEGDKRDLMQAGNACITRDTAPNAALGKMTIAFAPGGPAGFVPRPGAVAGFPGGLPGDRPGAAAGFGRPVDVLVPPAPPPGSAAGIPLQDLITPPPHFVNRLPDSLQALKREFGIIGCPGRPTWALLLCPESPVPIRPVQTGSAANLSHFQVGIDRQDLAAIERVIAERRLPLKIEQPPATSAAPNPMPYVTLNLHQMSQLGGLRPGQRLPAFFQSLTMEPRRAASPSAERRAPALR